MIDGVLIPAFTKVAALSNDSISGMLIQSDRKKTGNVSVAVKDRYHTFTIVNNDASKVNVGDTLTIDSITYTVKSKFANRTHTELRLSNV